MVRNLYILKIFSSLPGRGCVNNTGEPNFTLTNTATMTYNQLNTMIANDAHRISIILFTYFSYNVTLRAFLSCNSGFLLCFFL